MRLRFVTALATVTAAGLLAACGSSAGGSTSGSDPTTLRLGFFPNITHATALVGVEKGFYTKYLGKTKLKAEPFNAGPAAMQALFSGAIDATYIGPSSVLTGWQQSHGQAFKIIAGAAVGGADLVVAPSIKSVQDLKGKKVATPQLGNTQDVALRYYLKQHGLTTTTTGGGDVSIVPQSNSLIVAAFKDGSISGAWVPQPYAAGMEADGGHVLVNEASLWPAGKFVTTELIVSTSFLDKNPTAVKELLEGQVAANAYIGSDRSGAEQAANAELKALSGKSLKSGVLSETFQQVTFTNDPVATSLTTDQTHAEAVGLLKPTSLKGIYDLTLLNQILEAKGQQRVSSS
jgi:NitT/TauT family transport system substrate-binding protein